MNIPEGESRPKKEFEDPTRRDGVEGSSKNVQAINSNQETRPILMLVNPHSGRGKSISIYRKKILPFLDNLNIAHNTFITESDSRVYDYIFKKDIEELMKLRSIVVVSGDGLLHETINALMAREDWKQAVGVPIGVIPTGSGNGLAYTLVRQNFKETRNSDEVIKICTEQVVRDETCLADLVKITFKQKPPLWSFLSIGWGLLADIDIDSEWLRCLGELRFTIYGLLKALTSSSYHGRLSFKLDEQISSNKEDGNKKSVPESNTTSSMYDMDTKNEVEENQIADEGWVHIEDRFACLYAVHQSHVSSVTNFAPKSTLTDQLIYLTYIRGKLNPCRVVEFLLAIKDGSHDQLSYVTVVPTTNFKFQPLEPSKIVVDGEVIPWNISEGPFTVEVVPKVIKLLWKTLDD